MPQLHRLVKWRNQLLALFCLLAFAGLGVLYFQHWVIQKPFGIILFVGEGLSPSQLAAARVYGGGADSHLALDSMPAAALLINYSNDFAAPDSAAAATALATGIKTNNRAIGVDPKGKPVRNIVELARAAGRACGMISNSNLTDATPAAFYAHASETDVVDELALSLTSGNQFDIILGGGAAAFLPGAKNGTRHDDRDLVLEMRRNGFDIVQSKADLETVPRWRRPKLFGVFNKTELSYAGQVASGPEQPSLPDMVRRAVELLQFNPRGYLLIVDAGLIRYAQQQNNGERTLAEILELDRAVAVAREYAGGKSLILVAGDCAIGGLSLNGFPFRKDSGFAILGIGSSGFPWLSWATGPHGIKRYPVTNIPAPNEQSEAARQSSDLQTSAEPAAIYSPKALNAVGDVILFGVGPGAQEISGTMDNTNVFKIVRDNL